MTRLTAKCQHTDPPRYAVDRSASDALVDEPQVRACQGGDNIGHILAHLEPESLGLGEPSPVCPNCHAMIHRRTPAYGVEEVREMIGGSQVPGEPPETR